ncbi:MAG: hypothetical protein JNK46_04215, partial [Methylobacteriaceae bacterium]|nr:hypothetical protein [Methylobacteriaceae bacterium]
GYTYLMQLVGHDLVDAVVGYEVDDDELVSIQDGARRRKLCLETLYGAGPEEQPHAYAIDEVDLFQFGAAPRIALRLGPHAGPAPAGGRYCPMRDIARAAPGAAHCLDPGLTSAAHRRLLTEAMLADPRNDAHALLSQFVVLFQLFHNDVVEALRGPAIDDRALRRDIAYRVYHCARGLVTDVYREVLIADALPRLLDPRVMKRYAERRLPLFQEGAAAPAEFAHGVFRFGHAMVRDSYFINSGAVQETRVAMQLSSAARPASLPLDDQWFVDWARFFDMPGGRAANRSMPIGPHYAAALWDETAIPPLDSDTDVAGLADRDLLASAYAGLLSVRTLHAQLRSAFGEDVSPDWQVWRDAIAAWLEADNATASGGRLLSRIDVERIAYDPPLAFFTLFEAGVGAGEDKADGRRLGPLASFVMAETIFGAIAHFPIGFEREAGLGARIRARVATMLGAAPHAAAARRAIEPLADAAPNSMPELLDYLRRRGAFRNAGG